MNADTKYTSSFAGGYCLSTVALRQYIDGTLPKKSLHLVEKHLLDCDFCSTVLEDMDVAENAEFSIESIAQNVNTRITEIIGTAPKPVFWSKYAGILKGGTAVLVLGLGFLVYHFNSQTSALLPDSNSNLPLPLLSQPEMKPALAAADSGKSAKEDEFIAKHKTGAASEGAKTVTVVEPPLEEPVSVNKEVAKNDMAAELKKQPDITVSSVAKKPEPLAEPPAEKENFADLQIVSAKVLQKMTKTEGSSRKASKNGQLPTPNNRKTSYYLLEDMPAYPGGDNAMEEYLATNFKNPVKDKRKLTGPAVAVMFTVSSRGKISDVEITRSIGPELDVEIMRLISTMPQWDPGKHKGDITCVLALTVH